AAECIAISAACGLSAAPISWLHFHAIPVLTVPANAAAAPVVVPMLGLALLAAILPPLGPALAQLNGWCAAYLAGCARFFGGLPVIVDEVERWKAADVKDVAAYLLAPAPATVLALVGEAIKADSALTKAVAKAGQVLAYDVSKRKLPDWVAEQFARLGGKADA